MTFAQKADLRPFLKTPSRRALTRCLRIGLLASAAVLPALGARAQKLVPSGNTPVTSSSYPGIDCQIFQVPMRDGTLLTTRAYYPSSGTRPFPVIMQRDPYDRQFGGVCFSGLLDTALITYAQNGYVAMDQSVRGTYTSEGTFNAMIQERRDGYDAVEWAGTQRWSTGKVGMTSASYLGLTQWQAAIEDPPHLAAIAPNITCGSR
jgi:predicted acyl esterase